MLWLFFLPQVLSTDFYTEHIESFLNHSVNPCDDFYHHVCSSIYENEQKTLVSQVTDYVQTSISPFYDKRFLEFQENIEDKLNSSSGKLTEIEKKYISKLENRTDVEAVFNATMKKFERHQKDVKSVAEVDALNSFMKTEKFKENEKKMAILFEEMRKTVVEQFESAPWATKQQEFLTRLKNVNYTRYIAENSSFTTSVQEGKAVFEKCTSTSTEISEEMVKYCIAKSYALIYKLEDSIDGFLGVISFKEIYDRNAQFDPSTDKITLWPSFYVYDYEEFPFMLGSLLQAMSHELAHVFFHYNSNYPGNSDCFQHQMFETCEDYFKDVGSCVVYKTNQTFDEDASDWIAMTSALSTLKISIHNSTNAMKQLFYANAIDFCSKPKFNEWNSHSMGIIRVNGINRMMEDFGKTFGCKLGDRMIQEQTCPPFTGDGSPHARKRSV